MPDEKKTPLDNVVELALYAPLGLALTARDHLPDLIARGRQQVTSQVMLARMMGQFAVKEGEKDLRKRVEGLTETLSNLGILPEPNPPAPSPSSAPAPGTVPTPPPEATLTVDVDVPAASGNGSANGNGKASNGKASSASTAAPAPAAEPAAAVRSRADLSIPGYDTLSASQVVQRLAGLSPEELEDVRDYESGTRGRRTILSKIAQLQSDPSA
jgi:hypothetical protein